MKTHPVTLISLKTVLTEEWEILAVKRTPNKTVKICARKDTQYYEELSGIEYAQNMWRRYKKVSLQATV
jgi:hypothetical protein